MGNRMTILVVDDEKQLRRLLRVGLEAEGYRVEEAQNGREAIEQAARSPAELVILDLGLPDMEGLEVLKRLREWSHVPVIVLTVRDSDEDKIALLDSGADDYVTKPFSMGELLVRIRVAQRHAQPAASPPVFCAGLLTVDLARRVVTKGEREVRLTATEYALLRLFVQNAGKVLTHQQILREVWGPEFGDAINYLHVYMAHLRRKLEADPTQPTLFLTEPGVGYRLATTPGQGER